MKWLRNNALVFLLFWSCGQMLFGQGLDDYLDQETSDHGGPVTETVPDRSEPVADEKGAISGFVEFLKSNGLIPGDSEQSSVWGATFLNWGAYDEVRALKRELEQLGVKAVEGGWWLTGSTDYSASTWSAEELRATIEVVKSTPPAFRQYTTTVSRCEAALVKKDRDKIKGDRNRYEDVNSKYMKDKSVHGQTLKESRMKGRVIMFDSASGSGGTNNFRHALLHEMAHNYQHGQGSHFSEFEAEFWDTYSSGTRPAVKPGPDGAIGIKAYPVSAPKVDGIPRGSPVSNYGVKSASEDFAEAVAFFYSCQGNIPSFPKRSEFLSARLPAPIGECNAAVAANPASFQFGSNAARENFRFSYNKNDQAWIDLVAGGPGEEAALKWMAGLVGYGTVAEIKDAP